MRTGSRLARLRLFIFAAFALLLFASAAFAVPTDPPFVNDGTGGDITYVNSAVQLSANWGASTDALGIAKYWDRIWRMNGACIDGGACVEADDVAVIGWEDNGPSLSTTRTGLALVEGGTYYFAVKAEANGGLQSNVVKSNGQKVDTIPPVALFASDEITDPFSPDGNTSLDTATFILTESDAGSGILDWNFNIYQPNCITLVKGFSGIGNPVAYPVWDGKNDSGKLVGNGEYCAKFIVRDNALNSTTANSPPDGMDGGPGITVKAVSRTSGNLDATAWHQSHKIVRGPSNKLHMVYASGGEIYYTNSTDEGATWDYPINLSNTTTDSNYPALAIDASNNLHVVWQEDLGGGNKEIYYLSSSMCSWATNPLSCSGINISNNPGLSEYPSIAIDSSGWLHVVWRESTAAFVTGGVNPDIAYTQSTNGGASWSALTNLSSNTGTSSGASIAAGTVNKAYVVWWDDTTGNNEILFKRYSGGAWDASATNLSNNAGSSQEPAIVMDSSANGHAVWQDNTGGNNDIYYKMFNGTTWDVSATNISNNGSDSIEPNIGYDATTGDVAVAWMDNLTGNYDIYYKKKGASYGWNVNAYNISNTAGVASSYPSLNLKAASSGIDAVWTEGNAIPYTVSFAKVDTISPTVTSLTSPTHPSQTTWYNNNTPQWNFSGTDNVGGAGMFGSWRLTSANATETPLTVRNTGTYQGTGVVTYTSGALADGISYFHLIYEDNAGNLSTASDYQTRVDTSPPVALATPKDGPGADVNIWYFPTYFSSNWTATTDAQSGVTKYLSTVFQAVGACGAGGGADIQIDGWDDNGLNLSTTHTGLALTPGTTYCMGVKARNGSGLETAVAESDGAVYTVDTTPPANVVVVRDGTLASDINFTGSTTQLSANWDATTDNETGVSKYWYAIYQVNGTCADGVGPCGEIDDTSILLSTSGGSHYCASTADDVCYVDNGTATIVTRTGLTLTSGKKYYFRVKAQNGVGLQTGVTRSDGAVLDNTPPTDIASLYDGDVIGFDTDLAPLATQGTLSANWTASTDAESGIAKYQYAIGTAPSTQNTLGWTDNGLATSVTKTGFTLQHGDTYYFQVRAVNGAGNQGNVKASNGQKADLQGPTITSLTSSTHPSQSAWYTNTLPSYSWTAADGAGESGLKSCYRLLDATASQTANTVKTTGTAAGGTGSFTQGAALAEGVWYFHLACEDVFGNFSSVSNYTTNIDTSAPTNIANVYDGAGADLATTTAVDVLSANWSASTENLSGVAKYWYAIYHMNGLCVDSFGPCGETDDISIKLSTSGVSHLCATGDDLCFYDNGTAQNVTDTTVSLTNANTYYFRIKAQNGAGLQSAIARSNGIKVDNTGPTILTLTSSTHPTSSYYNNNRPSYSWTAQDNGTGIKGYYYLLDTVTSRTAAYLQTNGIFVTSATTSFTQPTNLTDGTWYFHIVGIDNGTFLGVPWNYTTKVDTSPPATIGIVYDGTTTTDAAYSASLSALSANWTASSDTLSGVAKYLYATYLKVGSCIDNAYGGTGCAEVNDTPVSGWDDAGMGLSTTKTGLTLTDGAVYYFSVKAQNGAGGLGAPKASNGVIIDSTPPTAPSFVYDGLGADAGFTGSLDTLSANWATSTDAQTGVSKYWYAIYKKNGACIDGGSCVETDDTSLVSFTSTGTAQNVTKASLALSSGSLYYFAVKAENGAGGLSSVTNSNGITIDATAPTFSTLSSSTHPSQSSFYSVNLPSLSWAASDNAGGSGINKYYELLNQNASETAANVRATGTGTSSTTFTQPTALADGTFYFNLVVDDVLGNLSTVSRYILNIDTGPPTITSIAAISSTGSATVSWTTSEAADSTVDYGTTTSYGSSATDPTLATSHSVAISGLTAGLLYHYRVKSKDGAGNVSTSSDQTFTTITDTQAPVLTSVSSATHPDSTKWVNNAKPAITWAATDDKGIAGAYILFDQTQTQTAAAIKSTGTLSVGTGTTSATGAYTQPANLSPDGAWYAHAAAMDNGGNLSNAIDYKLQIDTSPPSAITVNDGIGTDIDYTNSTTTLSATWSPSSDAQSGVALYYVAIGTTSGGTDVMPYSVVGTVTTYTKTALTLTAGATYYMSVKAENGAGVQTAAATTNGVKVDTSPPKVVSASAANETSVAVVFDDNSFADTNGGMDKTSAQTASNYVISPSLSVTSAVLSADKKSVTLNTSSQSVGKNYTVTVSGVKDMAGNNVAAGNNTATFKGKKTVTFASGKTMISLPFIPDSADPLAFLGTPSFTLKSYDPDAKSVKAYPDPFVPGLQIQKGYMMNLGASVTLNVSGTAVAQDASSAYRSIVLKPGWNVIGNPFDASIPITALAINRAGEIKSLEDAENSWWVGAFLWTYYEGSYKLVHASLPNALRNVEPWRGYLIYAIENCSLVFPVSTTAKTKEESAPIVGGILWSVQITAKTAKAKDDFNFAGVTKVAQKWSVSEPPYDDDDDYVHVYFEDGGKKLTSFYKTSRDNEGSVTFTVDTNAKAGEAVDLSFQFAGHTEGLGIMLTDLSSMKQVDLSQQLAYSYSSDGAPRQFKIDVKDKAKEEAKSRPLNITQLHNYPNPDRVGNTTFKYAVDGNVASVMIEVYTATGKLIDKIAGELDGDTVWKFGDSLPNGIYFYRLIVTDVNGKTVSKVNKLVVLK